MLIHIPNPNKPFANTMEYSNRHNDFPGVNHKLSLYIPRVDTRSLPRVLGDTEEYEAAAKDFIAKQFEYHKVGEVNRIDLIIKKNPHGYIYYSAFIYFERWYDTHQTYNIQKDIFFKEERVIFRYHRDWYWIVAENINPREETLMKPQVVSADKKIAEMMKEIETHESKIDHLKKMIASLTTTPEPTPPAAAEAAEEIPEKPVLTRSTNAD